MNDIDVKLLIKDNKWGIKFFIDGQWVDLVNLVEKADKLEAIKNILLEIEDKPPTVFPFYYYNYIKDIRAVVSANKILAAEG